jgi:hypothetical protein
VVLGVDAAAVSGAMVATGGHPLAAATAALWVVGLLACVADHRRPRVSLSALREVPRLASRLALILAGPVLAASAWHAAGPVVAGLLLAVPATLLGRFVSLATIRQLRRSGHLRSTAVIVGAGTVGREVAAKLAAEPAFGLEVAGVVDDDAVDDLALAGGLDELPDVVARTGAQRVLVTFGVARDWRLIDVIRALPGEHVEVLVVPRLFEVGAGAVDGATDDVGGIPFVWVPRRSSRTAGRRLKRALDVVGSAALLVAAMPLMAACALAVRLTSPGPVLFRQQRLGMDGRPFTLYKFRSMLVNSDSETTRSVRGDHRLTRMGRLLGPRTLDVVPQLLKVVGGDF